MAPDAAHRALVAMNARLYGDHPFSVVFPTEEQLQSYTIEDLRRYYEGNFGARRSHLFVSGRFDTATMRQAIIESFGTAASAAQTGARLCSAAIRRRFPFPPGFK